MAPARDPVNSHSRMGQSWVYACDFSGRGKWGRGVGYFCSWGLPLCETLPNKKTRLRAQKNNKGVRWALDWLINMPQGLHSARSLSDSPYPPNPSPANKHKPNQAYTRWGWKAAQGASSVDLEDVMTQDRDFLVCLFWYKVVWCNSTASCSRASRADTSLKGFSTMFRCTCFFCYTLASHGGGVPVIWYHHAAASSASDKSILVPLKLISHRLLQLFRW